MILGKVFKQNLGQDFKSVVGTPSTSKAKDLTVDSTASTTPAGKTAAFKDLMLYSMLTEKHGATAIKDLNLENLFDQYPKGSFDMKGPLDARNIKKLAKKISSKSATTPSAIAYSKAAIEKGKVKT